MKTYITYGFVLEDPKKIVTNLDECINKPKKALWGSPVDAEFGWKEWCENEDWWPSRRHQEKEDYFNKSFKWTLKEGSKILTINTIGDLEDLDKKGYFDHIGPFMFGPRLNFHKILKDGYSAVELTDGYMGHYFKNELEMSFNSWDCECIVVLDPDKVELVA